METTYRIHPAIGIARLGNSTRPDGWFLGPEAPGQVPDGPFKDGPGSIKRQGARFRIYEYQDGKPVREIDNRVAQIIWKVHLVNSKAAGRVIIGGSELRNQHIQGADRARLILDSGAQPISSLDSGPVRLQGHFLGCCVPLGDLRTDGQGRLIVLGGFGHSFSPSGKELQGTFNNDDWCDDSADGPVTATIHFADRSVRAEPAWVVVGPPDYAAPVDNASSLYDVIYQAGYEQLKLHHDPLLAQNEVSFTRHVYPLLQRTVATYGVIGVSSGETGHEPQQNGNFLQPDLFARLKDNNPDPGKPPYQARDAVFGWLRDPAGGGGSMPKLAMSPSLEPWKYEVMKRWRDGKFAADWPGKPPSGHLEDLPVESQPFALDNAALDACVGRAFYPGIEAPAFVATPSIYRACFRFDRNRVEPGDVTQELAIPWQTDFFACGGNFWPGQRPDTVFRKMQDGQWKRKPWAEGVKDRTDFTNKKWMSLGYVVKGESTPYPWVEAERDLADSPPQEAAAERAAEEAAVAELHRLADEARQRGYLP